MPEARVATVRNGWANALLAGCFSLFGLVFLSGAVVAENGVAARILLWLATAVAAAFVVRAVRAGLIVSRDGLTVRGFVTSHKFNWEEVRTIEPVDSGNIAGSARCVGLALKDGRVLRIRGAASYSHSKVQQLCTEALAWAPSAAS